MHLTCADKDVNNYYSVLFEQRLGTKYWQMVDQQQTYTQYDGIYANRLKVKAKHPNYLPCIECQWTTPINQVLYQHQNLWVYSLMQTLYGAVISKGWLKKLPLV